ncbi:hypothetical protein [Pleomorphomonas sp. NRK KF1]|uniref:hypothetical protein n=1 Tax=Pleomorphomonas sp. NRK KF1 TaxID=2943000 RepID=UPI002044B011|nr:hypothetical protein [Pleomorphomonas sp. NRK KF1]MCM5554125.1 hypothetical protein [Pleomorphomonas sp. NRK KF1]
MRRAYLIALLATALLVTLPLAVRADDAAPMAPAGYADGDWPVAEAGFDRPYLEGRLAAVRHTYTGALLRFRLASALSAQETAIGIRPEQEAAWRAYTNALIALVPKRDAVLSLIGAPDEKLEGPEAFGRAEALADALKDYAAKAETLKGAITALRATLTPEQLEAARVPRLARG